MTPHTMKAIQLVEIGEPLQPREVPVPEIGPQDALVRVRAAGICHSDVHYRAGKSPVGPLPQTLGHEVSGVVEAVGADVVSIAPGDRVCLHYLVTCGHCEYCTTGHEQFCTTGQMIGKHRDGGYAEFIGLPARCAIPLPDDISFEEGAVLMCSSATSFHALRKTRLTPGETVAVFGAGGLGASAVQLARIFGAAAVYAVDINPDRLAQAESYGAIPIDARQADPVGLIQEATEGRGVDVTLELIGLPQTMQQAVGALAIHGRAGLVGIADQPLEIQTYTELLGKEAEVIGCADHLLHELPTLLDLVSQGKLNLAAASATTIPLDAAAINDSLDRLEKFGGALRTVITP
jgi:2-desacetyl-2-hydroxyethyl bacteriochlorophyllide A dehydrogenase